jgi:predicted alpha/beta-fold hydrolase
VIPGIGGHHENDYIKNFVSICQKYHKGKFRIVVMNWPGCGDSPLTDHIIPFGEVEDLQIVINHISQQHPKAPIFAVGFSAGSNLLVRYLGQERTNSSPITAAIVMSNGYDAQFGVEKLNDPFMIYAVTKKMKMTFKRNLEKFESMTHIHPPSVLSARSIQEFDEHLTLKLLRKDAAEYYKSSSCYEQLQHIKIPILLLNAHDDPIVHPQLISHPKKAIDDKKNHNLILATTKYGGHLGWIQGGFFTVKQETWAENVAMEFIEAIWKILEDEREE